MKLDILTKQRIDKWFSEVNPDELLYITQKYLTQDQLQLLQSRVVGQSEQLCQNKYDTIISKPVSYCQKCGWYHN